MIPYIQYFQQRLAKNVCIMLSKAAQNFVNKYSLELITRKKVWTDLYEFDDEKRVPHTQLPAKADLFLIMPATANIIGKAGNGIADDLISTSILASNIPFVFAPSMNKVMLLNRAFQDNVKKVKKYGYYIIEPSEGIEVGTSTGSKINGDVYLRRSG